MKSVRLAAVIGLATLFAAVPVLAQDILIVGEVTYRERIRLPPDASLTMSLVDLDRPEADPILGATAVISGPGQVPLQYEFRLRATAPSAETAYGLVAEILSGTSVWFRNQVPVPIDLRSQIAEPIIVSLAPKPETAEPEPADDPAELTVNSELFDTVWAITAIAGEPVLTQTRPTLSIATDRRAGGSGGCNNYFAEAIFDGTTLAFGAVAATRMACGPEVMAQESALFAALAEVQAYRLEGTEITLFDEAETPLIALSRNE